MANVYNFGLSAAHYPNESTLQGVIDGMTAISDSCFQEFNDGVDSSHFSSQDKEEICKIFKKGFSSITETHNKKMVSWKMHIAESNIMKEIFIL